MAYPSFEVTSGDLMAQVQSNCRYLTEGGVFTVSSTVKRIDVERYAKNAYYFVVAKLYQYGYGTTPASDSIAEILTEIQALDTCVQIESSVPILASGEENKRYAGFAARRNELVGSYVAGAALANLGQTRTAEGNKSASLELTGRSDSRKRAVYDDSDVVPSRFKRGYGQQPNDTIPPNRTRSDG